MERKIVGITGVIGSGKDSFSKPFIDEGYYKISFADTLKDTVSSIFGWDRSMLSGDTIESRNFRESIDEYWSSKLNRDITPRWVLQYIGTDVLRKYFNDNIWIYSAERKILNHDKVIITDCRFINEIKSIKSIGGIIIEVQRNIPTWYYDAVRYNKFLESVLPESLKNIHASEYSWIGINDPSYVIQNNSTLEALHKKSYDIIAKL